MSSEPRLVYVETSVFLAYLMGEPGRVDDAKSVMLRAESGDFRMITSSVTLTEVGASPGTVSADVERQIDLFFNHSWLYIVNLDKPVAVLARTIAREHHLKPLDAIHVASAVSRNASELLTYDDKILRVGVLGSMSVNEPSGQRALGLS
jgi:predicted nucleic acid-binding protein